MSVQKTIEAIVSELLTVSYSVLKFIYNITRENLLTIIRLIKTQRVIIENDSNNCLI